jgi:hypothetical protein
LGLGRVRARVRVRVRVRVRGRGRARVRVRARVSARRRLLSPISERKISEKDCTRSAEMPPSAAYAFRLLRTDVSPPSARKPTPTASAVPRSSPIVRKPSLPGGSAVTLVGVAAIISA